jgi:hypothetical protein
LRYCIAFYYCPLGFVEGVLETAVRSNGNTN